MSGLPTDIQQRIAKTLAGGDRDEAGRLAGMIAAAIAAGNAMGFSDDLAALQRLAGTNGLGKLAKGASAIVLPEDLRARRDAAIAALEHAETDPEKQAAMRQGQALLDDIASRGVIGKALAQPQKMELRR